MEKSNIIRQSVNISDLQHGDTVEISGELQTVNKCRICHNELFGWTLYGEPYPRGITRVIFKVPTAFGFRYQ